MFPDSQDGPPLALSSASVSLSRARLASILLFQNCALAFGHVPCSAPCQKTPVNEDRKAALVKRCLPFCVDAKKRDN